MAAMLVLCLYFYQNRGVLLEEIPHFKCLTSSVLQTFIIGESSNFHKRCLKDKKQRLKISGATKKHRLHYRPNPSTSQTSTIRWSKLGLTRTKLLNITVKRMNHSRYLCSTRHLILHLNLSQVKCCLEDRGNIQHSGRQSFTSTMYLCGVLFGD